MDGKWQWQTPMHTFELDIISTYWQLFILYLVKKFAQNMQNKKVRDTVIGREVPFSVFVQNTKLYKQTSAAELRSNPQKK